MAFFLRHIQRCYSRPFEKQLSASGISNASDLGTNSYGICLTEKDIYVLHRQTNFMAVRDGGSTHGYA